MAKPTKEELMARMAELEKQTGAKTAGKLEFEVSVYGLGRLPSMQWKTLTPLSFSLYCTDAEALARALSRLSRTQG